MKALRLATAFNKDLKRVERCGYDRALLKAVVRQLMDGPTALPVQPGQIQAMHDSLGRAG
jgi:mRNA-degrading endonuclease YafQ of YafQ-DinJ toxin-antitoxin module